MLRFLISSLLLLIFIAGLTDASEPVLFRVETGGPGGFAEMESQGSDTWYESMYWTGPSWCRVGRNWQHPGEACDSIRTFIVPQTGTVDVSGTVRKLHLDGDGVIALIVHNGKEIWRHVLEGKDDVGIKHQLALQVEKGDTIQFRVNRRENYSCDTTHWNPAISFPGKTFSAESGFEKESEKELWRYEYDTHAELSPSSIILNLGEESDYEKLFDGFSKVPEYGMFPLVLTEWLQEDKFHRSYTAIPWSHAAPWAPRPGGHQDAPPLREINVENLKSAIENQLDRTQVLLSEYRNNSKNVFQMETKILEELKNELQETDLNLVQTQSLYVRTRMLKRGVLLAHPEFPDSEILFVKRRHPSYTHLVSQYFGWRQRAGGGIFVLENPGLSLKTRSLLEGQLPPGSVLEPRLSYDAQKIAFSFVEPPKLVPDPHLVELNEEGPGEHYFHLYEMNVDGSNLRQLTGDRYDDMMPEYLPDGGLAFVSTRRQAYGRCFWWSFGKRWHSYTLYRMNPFSDTEILNPDDLQAISFNDVNDWFPAVANNGLLTFARWDYIDRDAVTHQNLWSVRPDGTNPLAVWGNAAKAPHCSFQAKAIPNSSKFVFIASAHHSITAGPVCVLDPSVDANSLGAVHRLTSGGFPEAETWDIPEYYNAPWPFSERLFLVAYSPNRLIFEPQPNIDNALGLYLMDDQGNREILYRDPELGSTNPTPILPRPVPPQVSSVKLEPLAEKGLGEVSVINVYEGLGDVPRGTIKQVRIVQIFPKTSWLLNEPRIGIGGEENARAVLGVAPVEADGSARFLVPAGKPFLFQLLDENGFAYQTMRSTTSVMPGEQVSCVGCHEHRMTAAPRPQSVPAAFQRSASPLEATPESGRPYGFVEMIQPIFDAKCVSCHNTDSNSETADGDYDLSRRIVENGYTASYASLARSEKLVPRYAERNQIQATEPGGKIGARGSTLIQLLKSGHEGVELSKEELRRIGTWLDLNAVFYGAYDDESVQRQRQGVPIAMPKLQ